MNRSIKQYTLAELQALKLRLDNHMRLKGDTVTQQEKMLMQAIRDELQSRMDYTYGPDVNYGKPRVQRPALASIEDESVQYNPEHRGDYQTLADCYEPGKAEIWYFKPGVAKRLLDALEENNKALLPEPNALEKTHIKVGTVDSHEPREVFTAMQSDKWSPKGEAKTMMRKLGIGHISMAPGDVIAFPDRTVMVTSHNFYDLGQRASVAENINFASIINGTQDLTEAPAPMAFSVGDTVYYGSRSGTVMGFAGDRDKLVVELPNGSRDIFPVQGASLEKPKMIRRAVQWALGEDNGLGQKLADTGQKPERMRSPIDDHYSSAHFAPDQILYQGSRSGKFVRFADGLRKQMILVKQDDGTHAMFSTSQVSTTKPKFMDRAKAYMKGESVEMNENFAQGTIVYCGSRSGEVQGFAQGDRTKLLVTLPNGDTDVFPVEKTSVEKPSLMRKATQWALGEDTVVEFAQDEEIPNPGYHEGQMLYCGSRSGTFVRMAKDMYDHTVKVVVKTADGNTVVLPVEKVTTKKPGLMAKAKNFVTGESVTEGFQPGQTVYCNGKSGKVIDYARGDATRSHLVVKLANGQTDSFAVANTSTTPPPRKMAEDFGSSDIGAAMRMMVRDMKDQCSGHFSPTPEMIEQVASYVGSFYADQLGVDEEEAARIMHHHFMMRYRSGQLQRLVDEDTVVASAGTAGQVNMRGGVVGEEEEVEEADISLGVPKGEIYKPKMMSLHYFNTRGTQDWELEKLGMKKDKFGRYYLPQYDKSGINYDKNFNTLANTFGNPRTINLKK